MNEAGTLRRLPLRTAGKVIGAILAVAALLELIALVFGPDTLFGGFPNGTADRVTESVDAPPMTLSEAFARIDHGEVLYIDVLPDSDPDGARRWYGELESDGSLTSRWRVDGRDVLIDRIPILSADGQSVGLTEDEWTKLLERASAYNQIATFKITVSEVTEGFGTSWESLKEYTP